QLASPGHDDQRRELVESLLKQEGIDTSERIPRMVRDGNAPLSLTQERIWFLQQMESGTAAYNMAGAVRIRGALNLPALEKALNDIIARHEVMRTRFTANNGEPRQVIANRLVVSPSLFDLAKFGRAEREAEVQKVISADVERPFDLVGGPLLRTSIFRMAEDEN